MRRRYNGGMEEVVEWSEEQWLRSAAGGRPSTPDDVSVTFDGTRLDTAEKLLAFVTEFNRTHPSANARAV